MLRFVYDPETGKLIKVESGSFEAPEMALFPSINISYTINGLISQLQWGFIKHDFLYDSQQRLTLIRISDQGNLTFWERKIDYKSNKHVLYQSPNNKNQFIYRKFVNEAYESLETPLKETYLIEKINKNYLKHSFRNNDNKEEIVFGILKFDKNQQLNGVEIDDEMNIEIRRGNGNSLDQIIIGSDSHQNFDYFYENGVSFYVYMSFYK